METLLRLCLIIPVSFNEYAVVEITGGTRWQCVLISVLCMWRCRVMYANLFPRRVGVNQVTVVQQQFLYIIIITPSEVQEVPELPIDIFRHAF